MSSPGFTHTPPPRAGGQAPPHNAPMQPTRTPHRNTHVYPQINTYRGDSLYVYIYREKRERDLSPGRPASGGPQALSMLSPAFRCTWHPCPCQKSSCPSPRPPPPCPLETLCLPGADTFPPHPPSPYDGFFPRGVCVGVGRKGTLIVPGRQGHVALETRLPINQVVRGVAGPVAGVALGAGALWLA